MTDWMQPEQAFSAREVIFTIALLVASVSLIAALASGRASRRRAAAAGRAKAAAQALCGEGMLVVRSCGRVVEASGIAPRLLWGADPDSEGRRLPEPIRILLSDPEPQSHRIRINRDKLVDLALSPGDESGHGLRGIILRDVTREQRGRRHLLRLAHFDSLTGLANRRLFIDRLESAIERGREHASSISLFYIDLDRFKEVNDTHGHAAGDALLKSVARRLKEGMEAWETGGDDRETLVSRLSGDEFAVFASGVSDPTAIRELARSILERVAGSVQLDDYKLTGSASMGVSTFPDHGNDVEDIVKAADAALYVAKDQGRANFVIYEDAFRAQAEKTRHIEAKLRQAIEQGELQLHYQPKVELEHDTTAGFEALLRWYNEELGFVSPKDFIPIAEERGLICEIGAWCIDEACRQIRVWRDAGFQTVPVSVNVSSIQFTDSDLQRIVADALVRHDIEPDALEIELTESLILDDNDVTGITLRDLRAIGVGVALDDFGTGYSALTYLNRFPLDTVKMDRGFLRGIDDDDAVAGIAAAVITMSHSLGFEVVAEGVDSEQQLHLLRKMGCDQIQGFLFSPAVPADDAARFLAAVGSSRPTVEIATGASQVDGVQAPDASSFESQALDAETAQASNRDTFAERRPYTRVLVVDDQTGSLGPIALRMVRLGADAHMVQNLDEADLFVRQEEPEIDLLIVPGEIDLSRLAVLRERLAKASPDSVLKVLAIGDGLAAERRSALRNAKIDWLLSDHVEDTELRFFIAAAGFRGNAIHLRRSIRVPLETIAWIRAGGARQVGTLSSLSRRGAFIETDDEYQVGATIRIEFKVDERHVRAFGTVTYHRREDDPDAAPYLSPGIGVIFLEPDRETEDDISEIIEQIWNRHTP